MTAEQRGLLAPHFLRDLHGEAELGPLLLFGEDVALLRRGKTALRGECELLQWGELGGFLETALDRILVLEFTELRGDDADHDDLVALGQEAQRLEATGTVAVLFEEIAVVIGASEHGLGNRLVAA